MISRGSALGGLVTTALHGALALLAPRAHGSSLPAPPPVEMVLDLAPEPPPPAPVEPPTPPTPDTAPAPPPPAPAAKAAPRADTAPARPATVAQAGKALVADDSAPGEIADFSLVTGPGSTFAGGTTSSTGTGREPGRPGVPAVGPGSALAATPAPAAPPALDRSRPARPGAGDWNCSHLFPADEDAPDTAAVSLVVTVRPDGSAGSIAVASDPGHGFGAAARRCAQGQRFEPALDPEGRPTAGLTRPFVVRFRR